jgi:hypothetical protein
MRVNYLEKQLSLTDFAEDSLSVIAERAKKLITRAHVHGDKMSYWQLILLQSKANGCLYHGKDLPHNIWAWPKHTWFQERLSHHLKDLEFVAHQARN